MEIWIQQLINALTIGGMYTLVAVGFTIFFGVLGLINFAHGEVFMFGAFAALAVSSICLSIGITNGPMIIVLMFIFAMATCALLGGIL